MLVNCQTPKFDGLRNGKAVRTMLFSSEMDDDFCILFQFMSFPLTNFVH
jgi:hypothetical protein